MRGPGALSQTGRIDLLLVSKAGSKRAIVLFVVLTFAWAWGFGFIAAQTNADSPILRNILMMVAGFGPSLAGVALVTLSTGLVGLDGWTRRCLNWRINWQWFGVAFFAPPVVMGCALAMDVALGGTLPELPAATLIPLIILNFGLVLLIGGPLGEEFGWRGYLMPALTERMNWRAASAVVGVIWGLWHLPLFYLASTAQAQMPMPVFMLNILAGSILFGWLFERTQRSVLPALVLHTSLNAWAGLLVIVPTATTGRPYILVTGLLVLVALGLLLMPDRKQIADGSSITRRPPPC